MIDARKISELPETNIMKDSSCMPIVQDGETKKIYFSDLKWLFKGDKGEPGEKGEKGDTGVSIDRITVEESNVDEGKNKIIILKDNGQAVTFIIRNGSKGEKGDTGAVATVVQNTGDSLDNVMSQNAVSEQLSKLKGDLDELNSNVDCIEKTVFIKGTEKNAISDISGIIKLEQYSANVTVDSIGSNIILSSNPNLDSYYYYADIDSEIFVNPNELSSGLYFSICTLTNPTHNFIGNTTKTMYGDSSVRYRTIEGTLPTINNILTVSKGTLVVFTITKGMSCNIYSLKKSAYTKNNGYSVTYINNILTIEGNSVSCSFSAKSFGSKDSLFELQNLKYKGIEVFGTENDYIGPVMLKDEDIKGAKHGGETTDVVKVYCDSGELENNNGCVTKTITIYVESHISDEFLRISNYVLSNDKLTTYSYIKTLKDMIISRIWGCGIISSKNDNTVAWLNKYPLTDTINGGLGQSTMIVTQKGTLVSTQLFVNDGGKGQNVVNFQDYTSESNRKKLYYYDLYATLPVTSGTEFSNCVELKFN